MALSLIAMVAGAKPAPREEWIGTPARVFDGDSFVLQVDSRMADGRRQIEIRLVDIDAPEHGQPYGDKARTALDDLIWKERLKVVVFDEDAYHRKVGRVYRLRDGLDVNRQLVIEGHVWVYRRRVRDLDLYRLEREARRAARGLWALRESELEPPWRWRREHPRVPAKKSTARSLPSGGSASSA